MIRNWKFFFMAVLLASGCAYIKQEVNIMPNVQVSEENIGQGQEVYLRVVDDREDSTIGKRGNSPMYQGATIDTKQDVVEIFRDQIKNGLSKKGFAIVSDPTASSKEVRVEIRTLNYDTDMGFWTGGNIGKSAIKVIVKGDKEFEKMYRDEMEIRTAFVASKETNAKVINGAISGVLNKFFTDSEMLAELKK